MPHLSQCQATCQLPATPVDLHSGPRGLGRCLSRCGRLTSVFPQRAERLAAQLDGQMSVRWKRTAQPIRVGHPSEDTSVPPVAAFPTVDVPHLLTIWSVLDHNSVVQQSFWDTCWPACSLLEDSSRTCLVCGPENGQLAAWTGLHQLPLLPRSQMSRRQSRCLPGVGGAFIRRRPLSQRSRARSLTLEPGAGLLRPHFKDTV